MLNDNVIKRVNREITIAQWIKKLNIVYVKLPYYLLILNLFTFPYNLLFRFLTNQPLDVETWVLQFCITLLLVAVYKEIRSIEDQDTVFFHKIKGMDLLNDTVKLADIHTQFQKHGVTTFTYSLLVVTSSSVVMLLLTLLLPSILINYPGLLLAIITPPFFISNITKLVYDGMVVGLWLFALYWFILSILQLIEYHYWVNNTQKP